MPEFARHVGCAAPSLVSGVSSPEDTAGNPGWEWTEIEPGPAPTTNAVGQPFIDEHGRSYGRVVDLPKGRSLWLNGKYGPGFDDFLDAPITDAGLVFDYEFSPDGRRLAYAVRQSGRWGVWIDNRRVGDLYDSVVRGGPSFREDGSLVFLGIRKGLPCRIVWKRRLP